VTPTTDANKRRQWLYNHPSSLPNSPLTARRRIIDCGVAFTFFENMIEVLDQYAVPSFAGIANAENAICILLTALFVVSRVTSYVLDRPRKLWHCAETDRWFRFKVSGLGDGRIVRTPLTRPRRVPQASYNAHVSLLAKKKEAGIIDFAKHFVHVPRVSVSCLGIAIEISHVYHVTMFVLIPNAFMAMGGNGFRGVPEYARASKPSHSRSQPKRSHSSFAAGMCPPRSSPHPPSASRARGTRRRAG